VGDSRFVWATASIYQGASRHISHLATAERRVRNWHGDAVELLDIAEKFAEGATVAAIAIGAHGCDNADECNAFPWRGCR
jgi:hypothetical protein